MADARKARIQRYIAQYAAQGIHRTGTEVDRANAVWMGEIASGLGCEPEFNQFTFSRIVVEQAELRLDKMVIPGVPLFDCTYTAASGVAGKLGPLGSSAEIGLIKVPPNSGSELVKELLEARRLQLHQAIVVLNDNSIPGAGIATLNAEDFMHPFGPPVLQLSNNYVELLTNVSSERGFVTLVARCNRQESEAVNVGVTLKGTDPSLAPLVVMTPRSGWWRCASERGGGIAAFFEIMKQVRESGTDRDVIFTANSGHELDHLGLDLYLHENADLIKGAVAWIHLGANFATNRGSRIILQFSDDAIKSVALDCAAESDATIDIQWPIGTRPLGEARNIFDGHGRFVSILGANDWFHHPADVWPDAVDLETTRIWVDVFTRLALRLANG